MPRARKKTARARVLSSREVYQGPAFRVTDEQVLEPSGVRTRRDIVRHSGSVVILAVEESHSEPRILLERQYRHAAQPILWELPAGRMDKGEKDLAPAKRELLEETGYTATSWKTHSPLLCQPGFLAETMTSFCARGLRPGPAQPEADEVIQVRLVPLSALFLWSCGDD